MLFFFPVAYILQHTQRQYEMYCILLQIYMFPMAVDTTFKYASRFFICDSYTLS